MKAINAEQQSFLMRKESREEEVQEFCVNQNNESNVWSRCLGEGVSGQGTESRDEQSLEKMSSGRVLEKH